MSVDYYVRLEQARGPRPSRQVLSALSRALVLSADEREYLFRIAGEPPLDVAGPSREVPAAVRTLLEVLDTNPAYILDAKYDLLAWNRLATYFIGDPSTTPPDRRNVIRWIFTQPDTDSNWNDEDTRRFARGCVADLRAAMARYPGDHAISDLVTELLATSTRFAECWEARIVEVRRSVFKHVDHPLVGPLDFDCQVLHIPDSDQRMIVYVAEPGTPTHGTFQRLSELARDEAASRG